jgi:hypothetical protein
VAGRPLSGRLEILMPPLNPRESGKLGLAFLLWILGVPGIIVLLYLLFA